MTRAERLARILRKVRPDLEEHLAAGTWPEGQPPYTLKEHPGDSRVTLTLADGDTINGRGPTLDAALDHLESKLGGVA